MKKTIGVIFSGYGEQFVTMGKDLYDDSRHVQDLFEQASMCLNINFVQLCFASSDINILNLDKGYPAILLMQTSIYSELAKAGLRPDFLAGYGIGEYAASVASGSLSFSDALYILHKYAQLFKNFIIENPNFSVLSLPRGFTQETLTDLFAKLAIKDKQIFISAHNTENGFYVAGDVQIIAKIQEHCKANEIRKVKELNLGYELHSELVDSVVDKLAPYFFKIDFKSLKTPVITNADGGYVTSSDALESAINRRVNLPLLWEEVMSGFVGCDVLLCVGPGKQVFEWAQDKYPDKEIYSIQGLADLQALQPFLEEHRAGFDIKIDEDKQITLGTCHVDNDEIAKKSEDLTEADSLNELPEDYDDEEDDLA